MGWLSACAGSPRQKTPELPGPFGDGLLAGCRRGWSGLSDQGVYFSVGNSGTLEVLVAALRVNRRLSWPHSGAAGLASLSPAPLPVGITIGLLLWPLIGD